MNKFYTTITALILSMIVIAQSPEKMSYQAVIRNAENNLVSNQKVGMQISIIQGTTDGPTVYTETQTPTTNANGLVSIEIGTGNTTDNFAAIDWSDGVYFVKTETDIDGETNYTITGVNQLLSVPYALFAKEAGNVPNIDGLATQQAVIDSIIAIRKIIPDVGSFLSEETDPLFSSSVSSGISGVDTLNWNNKLDSCIEIDPIYGTSIASSITETNITNWNNKQDKLTAGAGIIINNNIITTTNQSDLLYHPQSASTGKSILVSFSGGSDVYFSQASPIVLQFQQATPIYPQQIRYVNRKKIDVVIDIPWDAATGTYDIIINPNEANPNIIEKAFLIDWFW